MYENPEKAIIHMLRNDWTIEQIEEALEKIKEERRPPTPTFQEELDRTQAEFNQSRNEACHSACQVDCQASAQVVCLQGCTIGCQVACETRSQISVETEK